MTRGESHLFQASVVVDDNGKAHVDAYCDHLALVEGEDFDIKQHDGRIGLVLHKHLLR